MNLRSLYRNHRWELILVGLTFVAGAWASVLSPFYLSLDQILYSLQQALAVAGIADPVCRLRGVAAAMAGRGGAAAAGGVLEGAVSGAAGAGTADGSAAACGAEFSWCNPELPNSGGLIGGTCSIKPAAGSNLIHDGAGRL